MEKYLWQSGLDFQYLDPDKVKTLQEEALLKHLEYCFAKSPFYRNRFRKKISSIEDFKKLSFTTKDDLLKHNIDFLAVPEVEIVDTCFTSATEGVVPVNFFLTKNDLDRLAYNEEVAFYISGIRKEDTMAVCVAIEKGFMAGLAYFLGGVKLGTHMIRIGASGTQHIWHLIKTHRPTALIGVPSLFGGIANYAISEGEKPESLNIKRILGIGEPLRDKNLQTLPSIKRIEALWNAPIYSTYASTEMSTSFNECEFRQGGHLRPEMIYIEIVDENGNNVPDGEIGEVVVTPLGIEGTPLVRFKTGDISFIIKEKCACGRTTKRIGPVLGRKSQQLKYKGTTLFPNAIVSIVEANPDFLGCYVEVYTADFGEDRVVVNVALANKNADIDKLKEQFRTGIRVVPELKIVSEEDFITKTQPPGKRKRQLFFDLRNKEKINE